MNISDYFLKLSLGSFAFSGASLLWFKITVAGYPEGNGPAELVIGSAPETLIRDGSQTVAIFVGVGVVSLILGLVAGQKEDKFQRDG